MQQVDHYPETSAQQPPRRRRRIVRKLFLALVVVIVLFEGWAYLAMNRAMTDARAGGRPLTFAEIEQARTPWPEDQNGATVLLGIRDRLEQIDKSNAFDPLPWVGGGCGDSEPLLGERWTEAQRADVNRFLQSVSAELEQIDRFRNLRGGRLPFDTEFNILTSKHEIGFMRTAMKLKSLQVMDRIVAGNTASLVDDLGIALNMNRVLAEEPLLVGSLIRIAGDALVVATLEQSLALNTLQPEQLIAIDRLLRSIENDKRLYWGMLGERACCLPACEYAFNNSRSSWIESHFPGLHALFTEDQALGLKLLTRQVDAAADPDRSLMITDEVSHQIEQLPGRYLLTSILVPSLERSFTLNARLTSQIRAARIAMAVERFRLDHKQFPGTLDQLVPAYLEKVPADPFDQKPMRYRVTAEKAVIYSVGEDLKDNGGDVGPKLKKNEHPTDWGFTVLGPGLRGRIPTTGTTPASEPASR